MGLQTKSLMTIKQFMKRTCDMVPAYLKEFLDTVQTRAAREEVAALLCAVVQVLVPMLGHNHSVRCKLTPCC